jgi:hypothetical protein
MDWHGAISLIIEDDRLSPQKQIANYSGIMGSEMSVISIKFSERLMDHHLILLRYVFVNSSVQKGSSPSFRTVMPGWHSLKVFRNFKELIPFK